MSKANTLDDKLRQEILEISYDGQVDKHRVAKEHSFSVQTAERRIRTMGLTHSPQRLIDMQKSFRAGVSPKQLAIDNEVSEVAVCMALRRRGEVMRNTTYFSDFHFFDEIDTEEKSYILGFIYADGCLHNNSLSIRLAVRDIELLHKIKKAMRSECPVKTTNYVYAGSFGSTDMCNFVVSSWELRAGLLKQGITERKTETCSMPVLPPELVRHFIRGYVDGDGSFGAYRSKESRIGGRLGALRYALSICVSPGFLAAFRTVFATIVNTPVCVEKRHKDSPSSVVALRYSGKATVFTLLTYLYKDATIYLDRKFNKYLQIVHNNTGCKEPVTSEL